MTGIARLDEEVRWIREAATDYLTKAHELYTLSFGKRADGKEVDAKIQLLLDEWIDRKSGEPTVAVPIELILAITLREGFNRKAGRPKKSKMRRQNLELAVRWAKDRAAELRQNGMRPGPAKEKAIKEAEQEYGQRSRWFYGTDASIIRDNWSKIR
jgi:hypothetical protein